MSSSPVLRLASALVVWLVVASAAAQDVWTVQTVALRDLREARGMAAELQLHGLPAYTEFTMQSGLQYVRVRVGCYLDRETAEAWAGLLRGGGLVNEAVPVVMDASPPAGIDCVTADVGFRKPDSWSLVSGAGELPVFEVTVAGHQAYLRFDGERWRVWQGRPPAPEPLPEAANAQAMQRWGQSVVRLTGGAFLCPGRLLASLRDAAVVDRGDAVVACRLAGAGS